MTSTPSFPLPNPSASDPWMTKAQIRTTFSVSDLEIKGLTALGYLIPIRVGPRMKRYWRDDVHAGIQALLHDLPPPPATRRSKCKFDWRV